MSSLLSTVAALDEEARAEFERGLVPFARRAAIGELAADVVHDAGNALFGLTGLLDLLGTDDPVDSSRRALLLRTADELDAAFRPLLRFARGGDDGGAACDLVAVTREAVGLYRHGERKHRQLEEVYPQSPLRVACPPSLAGQMVVHLLLAADPADRVEVQRDVLRMAPVRSETLHEVVARRIALDHGGSLERVGDSFVLRLLSA